eukprot:SAG31_NODE_585_length_13845_cov_25.623163_8_plen_58_part_00
MSVVSSGAILAADPDEDFGFAAAKLSFCGGGTFSSGAGLGSDDEAGRDSDCVVTVRF